MYADDQDEEVEEEEEFHEVEEEKHKTSQDAVNDSSSNHVRTPGKTTPTAPSLSTDVDWANIMLSSQSENSDQPASTDTTVNQKAASIEKAPVSQEAVRSDDDSIMNNIIKDTQDKLKIVDESCDSIDPKVASSEGVQVDCTSSPEIHYQKGLSTLDASDNQDMKDQSESLHTSSAPDCTHEQPSKLDSIPSAASEAVVAENESSKAPEQVIPDEQQSPVEEHAHNECQIDALEQDLGCQLDTDGLAESSEIIVKANSDLNSEQTKPGEATEKLPEEVGNDEKKSEEVEVDEKKSDEVEKKQLDLDEDVKNPQYIPKKGVFYEHDDRSHDVEAKKVSATTQKEGDEVETKEINVSKRTSSQEKQAENRRNTRKQRTDADRWNHDLFRGEKQKPKSKSELVNAYGYDIRQERSGRSQHSDGRQPRSNNNPNPDRSSTMQDVQRSRQSRDGRVQRQNQTSNRSRERRARRQNVSKVGQQQQRNDGAALGDNKRDATNNRPPKNDVKEPKEGVDEENSAPPPTLSVNTRREQDVVQTNRNPRNDSRGRRKTSRDRISNNDERLMPANTVMPPITTWSNEDMMKAEAFGRKSPPRLQSTNTAVAASSNNDNAQRDRSSDLWQQNKTIYQDRPSRNQDESRQQGYNTRGRYQERGDENHRTTHYMPRNQYHDRSNQGQDWHRANNFSSYSKPNDYVVKTQTFENSRLSQANLNRSNNRDLREVINERRMQGQQNYHNKMHHNVDHSSNQRGLNQGQIFHHQYVQPHMMMPQHHLTHNQQQPQHMHMMQPQQQQHHQQQQHTSRHMQAPTSSQQQGPGQQQAQTNSQTSQTQLPNHRQQPATTQSQSHQVSSRQATLGATATDCNSGQESTRVSGGAPSGDPTNSRPIIKTDAYTGNMHSHQHVAQHSEGHRSMGGPITQQSPAPASSHMVPPHLGASAQPQYYTPSPSSRDPTAGPAAVATAYHGYIPGGHAVMDTTRYHMASQQLTDHGYMATANQTGDVSGGVLHQQSMYPDTSAGGAVANSTFLAQHPGSTISPNTSIPVTNAGAQLPPVPYMQHSQYPPPPYSNPYSQPQHNQGPPQSGHAYPPYWTYI